MVQEERSFFRVTQQTQPASLQIVLERLQGPLMDGNQSLPVVFAMNGPHDGRG
jgi:hypothetical protein